MNKCFAISIKILMATAIIIFASYYFYIYYKNNKIENFTPKVREMYRPYLRKARIVSEGFYGDSKNNVTRLFRQFGLY